MNKSLRSLGKLSRILKIQKEVPLPPPVKRPEKLQLEPFLKSLALQMKAFEPGLEVLESEIPLQEGQSKLDLLAFNPLGEMILVWVFERLTSEDLFKRIPPYDWFCRNEALWNHLFPQVKKGRALVFKIVLAAREIDSEIKSVLPYLQEITLQIYHYRRLKKKEGDLLVIRPWGALKKSSPGGLSHPPKRSPLALPPSRSLPMPSLTTEEIHDLMGALPEEEENIEDEITDPFIDLAALKA